MARLPGPLPSILVTSSYLGLFVIFVFLTLFTTQFWWVLSMGRLLHSPVFLTELLQGAGPGSVRVRMSHTHLFGPGKSYFELFELLRLYQCFCVGFLGYQALYHSAEDCEGLQDKSNPDIVGSGVRVSMYILFLAVFASLFIGSFHSGPSGTKELGMATLISMYTPVC
jgi:hypothetical protein